MFWARGPWGPLGPRCRIRVETVTTYCQASYLLSGKLPTVRQAFSRYETSYLLSGKLPTVRHAPKRSRRLCTQQPHTCTQPIHRHAPKRHRHAPKRLHRLGTQQPHTFISSIFYGKPEFLGKTCKTKTSIKSHILHILETK